MISAAPKPTTKFEPIKTKTLEPIYDTFKGTPVAIPVGYGVTVVDAASATSNFVKIVTITPEGKMVKISATRNQLAHFAALPKSEVLYDPEVEQQHGPLTPRIYQEYGITFLLYKGKAELADAPGVGKTIQALEASYRACLAMERSIDPLNLCYLNDLTNLHDEKNTHPTTLPDWAAPAPTHTITSATYCGTTINVATHNPYYFPTHMKPIVVIVAPSHLCSMWFKAILSQYPNEHVSIATNDTRNNRMAVLQPGCRFYIVNYEMMREAKPPTEEDYEYIPTNYTIDGITYTVNDKRLKKDYVTPLAYIDALRALNPFCVVFDEAHRLKSHKSKQAIASDSFASQCLYRFLLTATPIKREADDLFWQLHILDPDRFVHDEYTRFIYDYCFYKQTEYGKTNVQLKDASKRRFWFNRIASLEEALDYDAFNTSVSATKHTSKKYTASFTNPNLRGYILGRSYADVGLYLPPVIPATIPVLMDTNIRRIYEELKKNYRASFMELGTIEVSSMIAMLHSLRILTACPNKYEAVQQLIEDNEGPYVIFCEYKPSGEHLAKLLDTTFISGEIPESERESLIVDLLRQGKPIVGMGRVIGTGINALANCNVIINFENDYTPGERTQRIGRVQRFSSTRKEGEPILLFDVLVQDSIDQHVYEVQKNRAKSIRDIICTELGVK